MLWSLIAAVLLSPGVADADPETPFSHDKFCVAVREIERQSNADRGFWLDETTRHDGMTVDCEAHSVELKLYVKLPFNELPRNWQDRMERTWSDDYCGDTAWAASITHHWRVTLIVVSIADEIVSWRADCH